MLGPGEARNGVSGVVYPTTPTCTTHHQPITHHQPTSRQFWKFPLLPWVTHLISLVQSLVMIHHPFIKDNMNLPWCSEEKLHLNCKPEATWKGGT